MILNKKKKRTFDCHFQESLSCLTWMSLSRKKKDWNFSLLTKSISCADTEDCFYNKRIKFTREWQICMWLRHFFSNGINDCTKRICRTIIFFSSLIVKNEKFNNFFLQLKLEGDYLDGRQLMVNCYVIILPFGGVIKEKIFLNQFNAHYC